VVHACKIGRHSLIGIGAIVLNGAEVGEESIVAAGSVVTPGTSIPGGTLAAGIPAKPLRPLREKDFQLIRHTLVNYQRLSQIYSAMKRRG
jgi:carbonic anhydrase/acetyltransferase-like protein (isoleucine patch superfamily)